MATVPEALADELGAQADELNSRITALNEQLGLVAFLQNQQGVPTEDACGIYKGMLTALTDDLAVQEAAIRDALGVNNNMSAESNFFAAVALDQPPQVLPDGLVKPDGCDAAIEEENFFNA